MSVLQLSALLPSLKGRGQRGPAGPSCPGPMVAYVNRQGGRALPLLSPAAAVELRSRPLSQGDACSGGSELGADVLSRGTLL